MTWLNLSFPNLRNEGFTVIEPPSDRYNCVAYTAGDTSQWWDHTARRYWPPHASRSGRVGSLIEVFVVLGYEQCKDDSLEDGHQFHPETSAFSSMRTVSRLLNHISTARRGIWYRPKC